MITKMEAKKSPKANLENKRMMFFQIGLAITLLMVLFAFEWKSPEKGNNSPFVTNSSSPIPVDFVPITIPETPPPPKMLVPIIGDEIEIVGNDVKLNTDLIFPPDINDKKPFVYYTPPIIPEAPTVEDVELPFHVVEEPPMFQGDKDLTSFSKWVFSNLVYPESAKETELEGRISVGFTVDTDGAVTNVKIIRGIHASLDNEVIRVISSSPKWTPGKQRDRNVRVSYVFPVIFELKR